MARRRKSNTTWREAWRDTAPVWAGIVGVLALGGLMQWLLMPPALQKTVLAASQDASVAVADLQTRTPVLFAAPLPSGDTVEFFVEREAADKINVAFSSCRRCYRAGHSSRAGQIICKRCNEPMPRMGAGESVTLEKDCKHVPIPFERSGGSVVVHARAVADTFARWYEPVIEKTTNR